MPTSTVRRALRVRGDEEILDCIVAVGRATGTEATAGDLVDHLRARIEAVRTKALRLPSIGTLCLEWSDPPFVAGHWMPGMVEMSGGTNLLASPGEPSRRVTWRSSCGTCRTVRSASMTCR